MTLYDHDIVNGIQFACNLAGPASRGHRAPGGGVLMGNGPGDRGLPAHVWRTKSMASAAIIELQCHDIIVIVLQCHVQCHVHDIVLSSRGTRSKLFFNFVTFVALKAY